MLTNQPAADALLENKLKWPGVPMACKLSSNFANTPSCDCAISQDTASFWKPDSYAFAAHVTYDSGPDCDLITKKCANHMHGCLGTVTGDDQELKLISHRFLAIGASLNQFFCILKYHIEDSQHMLHGVYCDLCPCACT